MWGNNPPCRSLEAAHKVVTFLVIFIISPKLSVLSDNKPNFPHSMQLCSSISRNIDAWFFLFTFYYLSLWPFIKTDISKRWFSIPIRVKFDVYIKNAIWNYFIRWNINFLSFFHKLKVQKILLNLTSYSLKKKIPPQSKKCFHCNHFLSSKPLTNQQIRLDTAKRKQKVRTYRVVMWCFF